LTSLRSSSLTTKRRRSRSPTESWS
jgi:hypothetical protein